MDKEIKKRYNAFWEHTAFERAVLHLHVTQKEARYPKPTSDTHQWESFEYRYEILEQLISNTNYYAEGFPNVWINLGPGVLAAMIGADYHFTKDTVWFGERPMLKDWADAHKLKLNTNNPMNRLVTELTENFCNRSNNRYIVGITDIGGTLDVLASLRGTESLLTDLYDYPDEVIAASDIIDGLWEQAFNQSYSILSKYNEGMSAWINIWCKKRWFPLQCDFSAMISPDSFKKFVLPSLERMTKFLDHSIYHLDGVGELPHLDTLLGIEKLDGIQWVPGDGKPGVADDCWFPYYEKIQQSGKNLVLIGISSAEDFIKLLKNLSHKGLFLSGQLEDCDTAEEVIARASEFASKG